MQQLSGINAVIFYSSTIFSSGNDDGSADNGAKIGTALVGVFNMVSTLVAMVLLKYFGRKTLLVFGQITMAACLGLLGLFFSTNQTLLIKVFTLAFVVFFEFSSGPILWLYNAEILPASGISVATFINWAATIVISLVTPVMVNDEHKNPGPNWTFWIYGILCVLGLLFVLFFVKETKGKTEQQIKMMYAPAGAESVLSGGQFGKVNTSGEMH